MMTDADLCRRYAEAISPDGMAVLLDENNKSPERVSVSEAVRLDVAFAVNTHPSVLALDLDEQRDWDCAEVVAASLPPGFRTVLVASGRPGHGHLWVIALPGWEREALRQLVIDQVPEWGLKQIRAGMPTRPPYAPHRTPGLERAAVLKPDAETALLWFEEARPRALPLRMIQRLNTSDPDALVKGHGKPSVGMTLSSVAMSAVGARMEYGQFERTVLSSIGIATEKVRAMSRSEARVKLQRVWARAAAEVRENPRRSYPALRRDFIATLRQAIGSVPWSSRTGSTDRKVYLSLLVLAEKPGTTFVGASLRQLAKETGFTINTVSAALRRIEALGLVRREVWAGQALSHKFELLDFRETYVVDDKQIDPLIGGGTVDTAVSMKALLDDIFTNGAGLGTGCRETWTSISDGWATTAEVAARSGKTKRTTQEHVRTLVSVGLAERSGHKVRRVIPNEVELGRLARLLGVDGKRLRTAEVVAAQQRAYREFYAEQGWLHPSNPLPGAAE